ncbi:VWFA and cache domain-containing protein 1-like isoform X2 [Mercenaria mercenaria]|uniref:VWFA and cache domain-containing protein 1-like isoform X2 n=1 Tax=Mercenaria mercenaria TaxID=6596 RepID=UPI00234E7FAB|nr:VWFA and cache domain-containing protein 1-like isoform X2 [Mercenaria mercenaria]
MMFIQWFVEVVAIWLMSEGCARCYGQVIDPSLFRNVLDDVANNALGVNEIQNYFNSLTYTDTPVDGPSLATEISSSLSSKFNGPIQALGKLKSAVERDISSFQSVTGLDECCQATGNVYNERFRSTVNTNDACITISENSPSTIRYPTQSIVEVMKENYRDNPELKWQYLGTEDGILLNYPSFKFSACRDYDPRFRPFYVSSATPVQKDVVVVIDKSGSMSALHNNQPLIQIAKQAAITVLQTLNPNDRFSVVAFSSGSEVLGAGIRDCISSYELSEATPLNIKFIEERINKVSVSGMTNYESALDTAFKFFESSAKNISGEFRERVIMFLTDGEKTAGGDPLSLIANRNGNIGNEVVILTYGLGASLPEAAQTMLAQMANQAKSNSSKGEIQRGIFEHIEDPSKLRSSMASYYNKFSKDNTQQEATFTVPYYDLFGLGLLTSLCLPVYKPDTSLFGVVCSDLTMSNLVSDITYFRQGENSYSFIIDGRGRTLMHPLLPLPSQASDDPIYVDIQHLERQSAAMEVIMSMKSGISGSKKFVSTRTISRGDIYYEGIETRAVESTYSWTPVPKSNFSLCIVVASGDVQSTIDALQPKTDTFFYHRMDLADSLHSSCNHFNRYATSDKSAVMITAGGFINPSLYLETEETDHETEKYTNFITGKTGQNPGFKPSIINSVTASYKAEEIWRNNPEAGKMVIWRYIGTTDGVMRMYPAVQLPKNYDHTRRPWYERSIANKGKLVLSAPYEDQWGSGFLITLSTAITEPGSSKRTFAITGTDFTITYLYNTLITKYEKCDSGEYECFLIDDSGFVILHRDFVETTTKRPNLENVHLTFKEPAIADDLVNNNIMAKAHCIDFENIKEQYSYRVTTASSGRDRFSSYAKYEIRPVQDTNVFIIIQQKLYIPGKTICCQTYGISPNARACRTSRCDCLCYKTANFNFCRNEYVLLNDAGPTCSPRTPTLETKSISEVDKIKGLSRCFVTNCGQQTTKSGCHGISGCSWCSKDRNLRSLPSPYCTRQESCYFGIESLSQCPSGICEATTPSPDEEESDNKSNIIGAVVGCVVAVAVIVGVGVFIYKKRHTPHSCSSRTAANTSNMPTNTTFSRDNPAFDTQPSVTYNNQLNAGNGAFYDNRPPQVQPSAPNQQMSSQHVAPPTYDESQKHPPYMYP